MAEVAIGIERVGSQQILRIELVNCESGSSWKDFLLSVKQRGLKGVEMVVSNDYAGLRKAIAEELPEAFWQRCYVHLLSMAPDHLARITDGDCLWELRWM